ncbi:MAG: patatin-like phospholipase family protein [Bacillota bacterium]
MKPNKKYILFLLCLFLPAFAIYAKERPKIGLVLSGGGSKGFAHIGTLRLLDSLKIPIDYITGTSMGGIVGALYSIGFTPDELEQLARNTEWSEIFTDTPPRNQLPHFRKKNSGKYQIEFQIKGFTPAIPSSLISGQKISLLLSKLVASHSRTTDFDSLPIPVRFIATDLISGKEIVLKHGSLAKAMRATMSIPTVFSPVEWDDYLLIDGGLLNNFPVDQAKKMGADFVIGVNVGTPPKDVKNLDNIIDIIDQTTSIPGYQKEESQQKLTDILVKPAINGYTAADFDKDKIEEIITLGNQAARENLPEFLQLKKSLDSANVQYYVNLKENRNENVIFDKKIFKDRLQNITPVIYSVTIEGNTSLPFEFIYNLLGVKASDKFDPELLEHRITEMYSLGYFETLNYEIQPAEQGRINLILKVKEKSLRKLLVGLRYDNQYKLVGIIGVQTNNILLPGVRTETELQFAGLTRFKSMVAYPTRSLNYPVYPYLRFNYKNVPVNVFDYDGEKLASYSDNSLQFAAGLGISPHKFWVIEAEYNHEYMNITPDIADKSNPELYQVWKNKIRKIQATLDFDLLDDILLPRHGVLLQAEAEKAIKDLGSEVDYWRANCSIDLYQTFFRFHTARLYGFYGQSKNLPVYKQFLLGGPESFIGYDYNQLPVNNFILARFDYRYEYKKDIFLKIMANAGYNYEANTEILKDNKRLLWGYGFAAEFLSPLGPLQVIFSWGEKNLTQPGNFKSSVYITAGYKF